MRRKPVGTGGGTAAQPSAEQPQKRQKTDASSAGRSGLPNAAARRDDEDDFDHNIGQGTDQSTDRAADDTAGTGAAPAQRGAAARPIGQSDAAPLGSDQNASVADADGGSAGLTALLGDYGSDSDESVIERGMYSDARRSVGQC